MQNRVVLGPRVELHGAVVPGVRHHERQPAIRQLVPSRSRGMGTQAVRNLIQLQAARRTPLKTESAREYITGSQPRQMSALMCAFRSSCRRDSSRRSATRSGRVDHLGGLKGHRRVPLKAVAVVHALLARRARERHLHAAKGEMPKDMSPVDMSDKPSFSAEVATQRSEEPSAAASPQKAGSCAS